MRESGSPERLTPRETDCGRNGSAELAKATSASKFWTSDDRAPRGHRERHAKKEWSAKARNHPRVASALPHSEGIAYKPLCGEIADALAGGADGVDLSDDGSRPCGCRQGVGSGNPAPRGQADTARGQTWMAVAPVRELGTNLRPDSSR
jgi:hypothetical protein